MHDPRKQTTPNSDLESMAPFTPTAAELDAIATRPGIMVDPDLSDEEKRATIRRARDVLGGQALRELVASDTDTDTEGVPQHGQVCDTDDLDHALICGVSLIGGAS